MKPKHIVAGVVVLTGVGVLAAAAAIPRPVKVETAEVVRAPLEVAVEGTGRARVRERYTLRAPVSGDLRRVEWTPGDAVEAGQPLASVEPFAPALLDARTVAEARARLSAAESGEAEARAAAERARIGLAASRRDLERLRAMGDGVAASQIEDAAFEVQAREQEVTAAERAVQRAQSEAQTVRAVLEAGSARPGQAVALTSPTRGRVLRLLREDGGPVQVGEPILEIGDPADLEVVLDLLTTQAVRVRPGARVALAHWGGDGELAGRVAYVEPSGFTKISALGVEEQRVNVIVRPDEGQSWPGLSDGYHVEARVYVVERPEVVQAPAGALFRHEGRWAVFVAREGRARLREVRVGETGVGGVEVLAGLEAGERVLVHPGDRIADGTAITD
jgi:HlyD family secretion protein